MAPDYGLLFGLLAAIAILDLLAIVAVFAFKLRAKRRYARKWAGMKRINRILLDADPERFREEYLASPWSFLAQLRRLLECASPGPAIEAGIRTFLSSASLEALARPRLSSRQTHRRVEAYLALGLSESQEALDLLVDNLARERQPLGRLVALTRIARHPGMPDMGILVSCIEAGNPRKRQREIMALLPLAPRLVAYFEAAGPAKGEAAIELFLMTARACPREGAWDRLSALAIGRPDRLGESAATILAERYPASRFLAAFRGRPEKRFRIPAARLLGRSLAPESLAELDPWFSDPELRAAGVAAAGEILAAHPGSEGTFLGLIDHGARGACLSLALEHRLPALLYHAGLPLGAGLVAMLRHLLDQQRTAGILDSLGLGLPPDVRAAWLGVLREELAARPEAAAALARMLPAGTRESLGLGDGGPVENRPQIPVSARDKAFLAFITAVGLALFPALILGIEGPGLGLLSPSEIAYRFIFDFQFLFVFYTVAVNTGYLILLALSVAKLRAEARLWELDLAQTLAGPGLLPSISIIAPAFNEATTIVESLNNMLSLCYPSYEVIVVNDGSKDDTLGELIKAFGLEPASAGAVEGLASMPVRAVYRSPALPNLTVVDKVNGGKADALNAGLNRATGDFVCTIDADSILDPQALLRAMFQVVASPRGVFAIGGNVFPVNGCSVDHGHIQKIAIPAEPLARFQVVEYLRSFVGGRLGWTLLNGLLIISGAFGIFRRESVMEVGGYLTGKGAYRHDTVGEDMEIVVRMTRRCREEGRRDKVEYAYNANCWTEVPEDPVALRKQRDRWHRGLMEVISFHRAMAFRPRYGAAGMLSMPYFIVFELAGPWLEASGYLVFAAALALNLIDPAIPLAVFGIAAAFGMLISIASILLAERQIVYFETRDFLRLLATAMTENFGFRQLMSMSRAYSNLLYFFVRRGWEKQTRKGFARKAGT